MAYAVKLKKCVFPDGTTLLLGTWVGIWAETQEYMNKNVHSSWKNSEEKFTSMRVNRNRCLCDLEHDEDGEVDDLELYISSDKLAQTQKKSVHSF